MTRPANANPSTSVVQHRLRRKYSGRSDKSSDPARSRSSDVLRKNIATATSREPQRAEATLSTPSPQHAHQRIDWPQRIIFGHRVSQSHLDPLYARIHYPARAKPTSQIKAPLEKHPYSGARSLPGEIQRAIDLEPKTSSSRRHADMTKLCQFGSSSHKLAP